MNVARLCIALGLLSVAIFADTNTPAEVDELAAHPTPPHATGTVFRFAPAHFSFTMPYYWTAISDSDLAHYKATLREMFPNRPVPNYVLAIQRKALFTFALPYALFEVEERPMPTEEEIEAERSSFAQSIRRAYLDLHRQGAFGEIKPMEAQYDPIRNVIIAYWEMTRTSDRRRIAALAAIFPCRYGFLRLHVFLPAERQLDLLPVVEELINSVTFDEGFGYDPAQARPRRRGLSHTTALAIFAALAIVWIALRILASRAAKKF